MRKEMSKRFDEHAEQIESVTFDVARMKSYLKSQKDQFQTMNA